MQGQLTTRLGNLKPVRVMLRLQNSGKCRLATDRDLEKLADVEMQKVGDDWVSTSSDPSEKYGTILAVMPAC